MKYSSTDKNKILEKILSSEWNTSTYQINNISAFIESCSFITYDELLFYLNIISFEHVIDIDIENNQINSIYIFPDAFSRQAALESNTLKFWIPLVISNILSLLSLIVAILAYIAQLQAQ